ncbi:MAG: hypothetical protein KDB10_18745 [Acidimicrobiales bacterium]|nr:hypothetical protein [Acidimicrobiales bacterium]
MAAVALVFGLLVVGGVLLHRWTKQRVERIEAPGEQRDLRDLADPDRWPSPPPDDDQP